MQQNAQSYLPASGEGSKTNTLTIAERFCRRHAPGAEGSSPPADPAPCASTRPWRRGACRASDLDGARSPNTPTQAPPISPAMADSQACDNVNNNDDYDGNDDDDGDAGIASESLDCREHRRLRAKSRDKEALTTRRPCLLASASSRLCRETPRCPSRTTARVGGCCAARRSRLQS